MVTAAAVIRPHVLQLLLASSLGLKTFCCSALGAPLRFGARKGKVFLPDKSLHLLGCSVCQWPLTSPM